MIGKKTPAEKLFSVCNIIVMMIFVFACLYPFYYMLIYSFSDSAQAYNITILPRGFTLDNYEKVFGQAGFGRAAVVSVTRTVLGTALTVVCCSFFGYLVTKQQMVGRKFIYRMLVITMYVDGGLVPTYLVYRLYGLTNNFLVYLIPTALTAYNVILIKTFIEQLPPSLEESAMLDGAGPLRCWWSIVLPLSKPILATIAVFAAVGQWNAWFDSHIYVTKDELWSLQYVLYRYLQQVQDLANAMAEFKGASLQINMVSPATVRMTITAVVTIPILFVYPVMQRYFLQGLHLGAVKG